MTHDQQMKALIALAVLGLAAGAVYLWPMPILLYVAGGP